MACDRKRRASATELASFALVNAARRLVAPDAHHNCAHCDHDVEVCDCILATLRASVGAFDEIDGPITEPPDSEDVPE
jgi:hypothetical protein